jgi:hypothetical protein
MDPHICCGAEPRLRLSGEAGVAQELPTVQEITPEVADRTLHLSFGLRPIGATGSDPEATVRTEAEELGVFDQAISLVPQSSVMTLAI